MDSEDDLREEYDIQLWEFCNSVDYGVQYYEELVDSFTAGDDEEELYWQSVLEDASRDGIMTTIHTDYNYWLDYRGLVDD